MKLLIRWAATAAALYAAQYFVTGITVGESALLMYAVLALVVGLVMAFIKPILTLLTCPLHVVTFGLFALVVNALAFWMASGVAQRLGLPFHVDGFVSAFIGALIVSGVLVLVNAIAGDDD